MIHCSQHKHNLFNKICHHFILSSHFFHRRPRKTLFKFSFSLFFGVCVYFSIECNTKTENEHMKYFTCPMGLCLLYWHCVSSVYVYTIIYRSYIYICMEKNDMKEETTTLYTDIYALPSFINTHWNESFTQLW